MTLYTLEHKHKHKENGMEKFAQLFEEDYFKYLSKDYIAIAKIHKIDSAHLKMTFKDRIGARNAYNEIAKDNRAGYHTTITNNVVEILKGDYK